MRFLQRLFVYSGGGPERKVDNLSVQKFYIALFLEYNFDEVLIARAATNLSYPNLVERVHSVADLGLQSIGLIGKMFENVEKIMRNASSKDELQKLCEKIASLKLN